METWAEGAPPWVRLGLQPVECCYLRTKALDTDIYYIIGAVCIRVKHDCSQVYYGDMSVEILAWLYYHIGIKYLQCMLLLFF